MTTKTTIEGVPRYIGEARIVGLYYPARCTKCGWLGSSEDLTDEAECTRHEGDRLCLGYTEEVDAVYLLGVVQAMAKTAAPLDYGSLDAVQRLAVCRGDVVPASAAPAEPNPIKGMIETIGGQYAVMIDPENGHYGWTFKKHPDGQWVSGRKATEREMIAARSHAQITNQL